MRWLTLALVLALAGCAGKPAAPDGLPDTSAEMDTAQAPRMDTPAWQEGQWWEWEVSFGSQVSDTTFCSIVVGQDGSQYTVATENPQAAKDAAAFGRPLLGAIGRSDLAMTGWGDAPWTLLSFPLTDGKAWQARMPNIAWDIVQDDVVPLDVVATWDAALGDAGGFRLSGTFDGKELVQAEVDVATGWFAGVRFYDVDPGQEELEIGYRAKSTGLNYTGPYYIDQATLLVQGVDRAGFSDVPTEGGQPYTDPPQPTWTFTMQEGTLLYGHLYAETVAGTRVIDLGDPTGAHRQVVSTAQADDDEQLLFLDEPSVAGEWRIVTSGAGGFSLAQVMLFEVTEGAFTR